MTDVKITSLTRMALTDSELRALKAVLDTGDRAGFDMAYFAMTGTATVALEARISTFSGPVGGIAFAANRIEQEWFGPGTGASTQYAGIYFLSHKVALRGYESIEGSAKGNTGSTAAAGGYIEWQDYLKSARAAWQDAGQESYFPGNTLQPIELAVETVQAIANAIWNLFTLKPQFNGQDIKASLENFFSPGTLASLLAHLVYEDFAKRPTDFYSEGRIEGPNGYSLQKSLSGITGTAYALPDIAPCNTRRGGVRWWIERGGCDSGERNEAMRMLSP